MKIIMIDIEKNPPSLNQLAERRKYLADQSHILERQFKWLYFAIGFIVVMALIFLRQADITTAAAAALLAGVGAAGSVVAAWSAAARMAAGFPAGMLVGVGAVAAVIALAAPVLAGVGVIAAVVAVAITAAAVLALDSLNTRRTRYEYELNDLIELEHSESPKECVQFVAWCKADPVLTQYQHAITRMGRKPIKAEYIAAKAWSDNALQRREREALLSNARVACDELSNPIEYQGRIAG